VAELQRSKRAMTEMSGALREAEERMGRANATKDGLLNHVRLLEGEVRRLQAAGGGGAGDSDVAAERERMHDALVREGAAKRELEDEVLRMEQELVRVRRDEERRARDAKRGMASARCETRHGEREMRNVAWRARDAKRGMASKTQQHHTISIRNSISTRNSTSICIRNTRNAEWRARYGR
jgi:hypothetical protein